MSTAADVSDVAAVPTGRRGHRSVPRVLLVTGIALLVMVPVIATAIAIVRPQWYPTGDMAQAELHVRGFWSHPPLVGAAGRIQNSAGVQGSHPGPLLWLAIWPLYALGGSTSTALVASVVAVHTVGVAVALWLAVRRGGWTFAILLAVVLAVIVRAGGPDQFTEPWNPWMGLLPFLVLLLAGWTVLDGEHWALVLAAAAGTYSVQAHTGYVLIVGALLLLLGAVVVWRVWHPLARSPEPAVVDDPPRPGARRWSGLWWVAAAIGAGLVLWIPPLIDQLRRDPGNLSILVDSFSHPDAPYLGIGTVAKVAVVQFNLFGPWLLGPGRGDVDVLAVLGCIGFLALWAAAIVVARRRHARSELHLHALLAVAAVLAVVSISRIFGLYLEYTVRWVWLITGLVIVASIRSLTHDVHVPASWRRPAAIGAMAVAALGLAGASWQLVDRAGPTGAIDSRIVAGLVPQVEAELDVSTPYLVRWSDPSTLGALGTGLVLELERRGFRPGVDQQFAAAMLPSRVLPETSAGGVLYVVSGEAAIEQARTLPGVIEVASYDVRTPAQQERSDQLRFEVEDALRAEGREDQIAQLDQANGQAALLFADPPLPPAAAVPLQEYVSLRLPAAVFLAPPGTPVLPLP